ncbi:alanine--tRNA ligase [Candidatus Woesebacteria bacterium]|nr:alanine--tRNA ligase [Candidatus Woesebacteria bacterium]
MKTHSELRRLFTQFWKEAPRNHTEIPAAPLVLANDATTLFTSSGMQPLVPYLIGEKHPLGTRLFDIQPSIRTQDIEEVGNNRHTTFFHMMGNWSLGEYFKEEQLAWKWEFFTKVLGLPKEKLYVSVFEGNNDVPRDNESAEMWKKLGIEDDHLSYYGVDKNWWSRSGPPDKMPEGEIGGPDSEVFYDFGTEHDSKFGEICHPNCDCGRFMEIGNSVFIQYIKRNGKLEELPQKNVDFGGGFERILAAWNDNPDIFSTDIFTKTIIEIEKLTGKNYEEDKNKWALRVIADHMRGATYLVKDGVTPGNKEHGYVLRRLLRRSAVKMYDLTGSIFTSTYAPIVTSVIDDLHIAQVIDDEMKKFNATLEKGLLLFEKEKQLDAHSAFNLFQSYGFPFELTQELALKKGINLSKEDFDKEFEAHKQLSKTTSAGKFKGGLADQSDQVLKYHTATHLLHKALQEIYGDIIRQEGSNITQERMRFDTRLDHKPTDDEVKRIEDIINEKIKENLPVYALSMSKQDSEKLGASAFFKEKYGDMVQVYCIGGSPEEPSSAYSKELCGGPHIKNTGEIGEVHLSKVKKIGTQLVRFYLE